MQTHQVPPPPAQLSDSVFIPPPERIPAILDHLDSAFSSLADVASVERTTVEALSAWLMQPEVQERQRAMDSAAATRSRSLATRNLHLAVAALSRMIQGHVIDDKVEPYSTNTKEVAARARLREVTRKACFLLMRIATFDPASPSPSRGTGRGGRFSNSNRAPKPLDLHQLRASGATARHASGAAVVNSEYAQPRRDGCHPAQPAAPDDSLQHAPSLAEIAKAFKDFTPHDPPTPHNLSAQQSAHASHAAAATFAANHPPDTS